MRFEARPLLRLIDAAICERERARNAAMSDVKRSVDDENVLRVPAVCFQHVKAHTGGGDFVSLGNKCVDFLAKHWRTSKRPCAQLLLASAEPWMSVHQPASGGGEVKHGRVITGDVRRAVWTRLGVLDVEEWMRSDTQRGFAPYVRGARELWRFALGCELAPNTATPVDTYGLILRVLTDSLQHHNTDSAMKWWRCTFPECGGAVYNVYHLLFCPHPSARKCKIDAKEDLMDALRSVGVLCDGDDMATPYMMWFREIREEDSTPALLMSAVGAFTSRKMSIWLRKREEARGQAAAPPEKHSALVSRVCAAVRTVCLHTIRSLWLKSAQYRKAKVVDSHLRDGPSVAAGVECKGPSLRRGPRPVRAATRPFIPEEVTGDEDSDFGSSVGSGSTSDCEWTVGDG